MKTWLITGCSSGLGRGIAEAALKHGENVVVTARNVDQISVHSGGRDKHAGSQLSEDRLSGGAADFGEFPDQLHAPGDGQGNPVCDTYVQQTGAS